MKKMLDWPLGDGLIMVAEVVKMLINEVCKITGLTKKAIEYYMEKGLIAPGLRKTGTAALTVKMLPGLKRFLF